MRVKLPFAPLLLVFVLAGCDGLTDKANEESLQAILQNGPDAEGLAKNQEQLNTALNRDDAAGRLASELSSQRTRNSADLSSLMEASLERNAAIGRAAQGINRAQADRLNAIFGYLPQVSITFQQDNLSQKVISSDNQVFQLGNASYGVSTQRVEIAQPIVDLSRIWSIRIARSARTLAEIEYTKAVKDTMAEVFDTYMIAYQAQQRVGLLSERLELLDRQTQAARAQTEAGQADDIGVQTSLSDQSSLAAEIAFERSRLATALGTLSRLSGTRVRSIGTGSLPSPNGAARRLSEDRAVALGMEENPSIMAAAFRTVMSDLENRKQRFADFAPVLSAYASLEKEDRGNSRFGGGSVTEDQTIGIRLTIPVFNAAGTGMASLTSGVNTRLSVVEYFALRDEIAARIIATRSQIEALEEAQQNAAQAAQEARVALQRSQSRVNSGEAAGFATLSHALRAVSAEERAVFYQTEYLRAWGQLQYLTGASLRRAIR